MIIEIQNVLVSKELMQKQFACNLARCQGACCEEGDLGAPLLEEELILIERSLNNITPFLTEKSKEILATVGFYERDITGEAVTPIINGRECVFAYREGQGAWKCSFEKAWQLGLSDFRKPISCHLYPVRLSQIDKSIAANVEEWEICRSACEFSSHQGTPLFIFLKDALIRKFGETWYNELQEVAALLTNQKD